MLMHENTTRYKIIESDICPLISESRVTVYDVLEAHNSGLDQYEISSNYNLSPLQVEVALQYIEAYRTRLQPELDAIIKKAGERKKHYEQIAQEKRAEIQQRPSNPARAQLQSQIKQSRKK